MRLIVIILVSCGITASAQTPFQDLSKKAIEFEQAKQLDSSIFYFQQAALTEREHVSYVKYRLANLYLQTGRQVESERCYLSCLADTQPRWEMVRERASIQLADLYQQQGKFQEALTYLQHSETTYRAKKRLCEGGFGFEHRAVFNYKKARAYSGLGRKSEAVATLAPWVFRPLQLDPCESAGITAFFVNTLIQLYGRERVQQELSASLEGMYYSLRYEKFGKDYTVFANAGFHFFGIPVPSDPGGYSAATDKEVPEFLQKEFILSDVRSSLAWKYISGAAGGMTILSTVGEQ